MDTDACALGLTRIEGGRVCGSRCWLIRPPSPQVQFTEIHGLTWEMLHDQPTFAEIWPEAADFIRGASWLLAHNATFDRRVLRSCCRAAGFEPPAIPFLCTLKGSRRALPIRRKRLNAVCEHFGIPLNHHNAASDANACAEIYLRLRGMGLGDSDMRL